jgi:hypothetical protein
MSFPQYSPNPCSVTGSYTFLRIFLSEIFNIILSYSVLDRVSLPYNTTGFNIVLYDEPLGSIKDREFLE